LYGKLLGVTQRVVRSAMAAGATNNALLIVNINSIEQTHTAGVGNQGGDVDVGQ
jgi:hypothetical protein